jgi:hypothetical protein
MPKDKVSVTLELERDQLDWLNSIGEQHKLRDQSKVARVLLDYAMADGDAQSIFARENARCLHCGG